MMSDRKVSLTVNGTAIEAPDGQLLIHALRNHGVEVPTLCHDERLTPYGGCRVCVVMRKDGRGVLRGMEIETSTPEVVASRRSQLQLLALNHRMECPVCERKGDCRLQDLIYEYGTEKSELPFRLVERDRDERSPVIVRDPEKCVICGKCVRLCDEVQGVGAIGLAHRGLEAHVSTFLERPLDCEFCGQCVNACPVGALVARPYVSEVPVWQREARETTCSYCSCGCQVTVESRDGELLRMTSSELSEPNRGKLCVKGWLGWDVLRNEDRLQQPLVRKQGKLVPASWSEALDAVAQGMEAARNSGRTTGALVSPRLTTEDAYLASRLMRGVLGSANIDVGPTGGVRALVEGAAAVTGEPVSTGRFEDLRDADTVLVLRADPTRTHPLAKTEIVQGVKQRGQRLVMAHTLSGGLEKHAHLDVALTPATDETFALGLCRVVLEQSEAIGKALADVEGFATWRRGLEAYAPARVADICGVAEQDLRAFARALLASRKLSIVVVEALGVPGDEVLSARSAFWLARLLEASETVDDAGVLLLGEKANLQGVLDAGVHPALLPGRRRAVDDEDRREVAGGWGVDALPAAGLSALELFESAARDEVGLLYLVGQDPVTCWPMGYPTRDALAKADFVVVQDAFLNETASFADVVLPVTLLGERSGRYVGPDGAVRSLERVLPPPAPLPQDGELFAAIAGRLGVALPAGDALESELGELGVFAGGGGRETLRFEELPEPVAPPRVETILLDASPQLFHSGSMTFRSAALRQLAPLVGLRLSPIDARSRNIRGGDLVRVSCNGSELHMRARLDSTIKPGTVFVPWIAAHEGGSCLLDIQGDPRGVDLRRS
jgi:predicted molibdopterin-dependent oxidoreductase YjgC